MEVKTPDQAFNVLGNVWLKYQAISGRLGRAQPTTRPAGRTASATNSRQPHLAAAGHAEETLEQIRLHARHQYADGVVHHWWHPLAEEGYRSGYSDDLLWLPYVRCTTCANRQFRAH